MASASNKFENLIDQWEAASPDELSELAADILRFTSNILESGKKNKIPDELWHRFLNITGRKIFIASLASRDDRYRWADIAIETIHHSNYNLLDLFEDRVNSNPDKTLFQDMSGPEPAYYSYEFIKHRVESIAATFYKNQPSPKVAIIANNCIDGACCDLACLLYDIFVTPLNIHFDIETIAWIFDELGINIAVTDNEEHFNRLIKVRSITKTDFKIFTFNPIEKHTEENPSLLHREYIGLDPNEAKNILDKRPRRKLTAVSTIMFTSGSTGRPKGVSFSNFNLVTKRFARAAALPEVGDDEILLCYLPLFHTFGRFFEMMGMLYWEGTYVFPGNPSIETLLNLLSKINPTGLIGVPVRWTQIEERCRKQMATMSPSDANIEIFRNVVGQRLSWGLSAAGYLSPKVFRFFNNFGVKLCSGFGMTEATGGITMTPPNDYLDNSIGIHLLGVRTRLVDSGEIEIAGPYIARYLEDKGIDDEIPFVRNAEKDYWLSTGDLFQSMENEHYGIIDRVKDIYKNNKGQTIAPKRVEQIFEGVPDIERTFLVGDARDYNVLLIVPNYDDTVIREIGSKDSLHDYYHHIVTNANRELAPYERIINFAILSRDFDIDKDELTPKGSYRRKIIEGNFNQDIENLYVSNYVELEIDSLKIKIPRWFFRDLGILESDLQTRDDGIYNPISDKFIRLSATEKSNTALIGSLVYELKANVIDFGILGRQPRLWLGNSSFTDFYTCKEGWDTRVSPFTGQINLPGNSHYSAAEVTKPDKDLSLNADINEVNSIIASALFGHKEMALNSIEKLSKLFKITDERLGNVIRRRLESLATHDEFDIRSLAYRILLVDEPTPNYEEALPAFIESGLPFLDKDSIEAIASSPMNKRRLESLRQRMYSYRTKLKWPASEIHRQQFVKLFELLVNFANYHPEYYDAVRSELASWILHKDDPELSEVAEREFSRLYNTYETNLAESSPEFSDEHWDSLFIFGEELGSEEIERIKEVILGTTFLKQSIIIAFDDRLFEIDQIKTNGIWISRIISRRKYLRYRISINTRTGKHYDLQLILNEDINKPDVLNTIYWLMTISSYPYGQRILPRLGCCRPELGARSLVYRGELTVWERIRELSGTKSNVSSLSKTQTLKKIIVKAITVLIRGWKLSGERIVPGAIASENVMVPYQDFKEGSMILSLTGWRECPDKLSLIRPMISNFLRKTGAHYPWCVDILDDTWIFDGCIEELGTDDGLVFLSELLSELEDLDSEDELKYLGDVLKNYISTLQSEYYAPIRVQNAISRYDQWAEINLDATSTAKQQLINELIRLYRFDRLPEIARYYLYRQTYFKDAQRAVRESFDRLINNIFNNPTLSAIRMVELTTLQEAIQDADDRAVFGQLIFPLADKPHKTDLLTVGDSEHKQIIIQTSIVDKSGESHIFREPIEPSEIGQLYRLFFKEGYSKTVNESDRFLIVADSYGQIIGGLCYRYEGDDAVLIDGSVVASPFMGRGIGGALLEDFCNRMAHQKIRVVKTHFYLRKFYLRRGFVVDQKWGALVRFLKPIAYEDSGD